MNPAGKSEGLVRASSRTFRERFASRKFGELVAAAVSLAAIGASAGEAGPAGESPAADHTDSLPPA